MAGKMNLLTWIKNNKVAVVPHLRRGKCWHSQSPWNAAWDLGDGGYLWHLLKCAKGLMRQRSGLIRDRTIKWISVGVQLCEGGGWHNKWAWKFHGQFQLLSVFFCFHTRSCCLWDSQKDESSWILTQRSVLKLWRTRQSFLWICWRNICRDVIFVKDTVNICWGIVIEEDSNLFLIFIRFVFTFHSFIFRKCFVLF